MVRPKANIEIRYTDPQETEAVKEILSLIKSKAPQLEVKARPLQLKNYSYISIHVVNSTVIE